MYCNCQRDGPRHFNIILIVFVIDNLLLIYQMIVDINIIINVISHIHSMNHIIIIAIIKIIINNNKNLVLVVDDLSFSHRLVLSINIIIVIVIIIITTIIIIIIIRNIIYYNCLVIPYDANIADPILRTPLAPSRVRIYLKMAKGTKESKQTQGLSAYA